MNILTVTIVGANGTMGSNVGGIFASFGNTKVYMVSRDIEKSKNAAARAVKSVRADSISHNLIPADYSMLDACVRESDFVFESVSERLDIKLSITKRIARNLREDAIASTGTSGLSVTRLAAELPSNLRKNYLGVHFFNPPYNMILCEVIPTEYTSMTILEEVRSYLSEVLFRTVVESKDSPAFIGNRIGFHFIGKALQFAEKYQESGGIDYIDAILGAFTGRSMAPLTTADFVGLDICKAIVDNIYENTNDYENQVFLLPQFAQKLIDNGNLGRKSNGGLYRMEVCDSGEKRLMVYDIHTSKYREKGHYAFPFAEEMISLIQVGQYQSALKSLIRHETIEAKICLEFLLEYILYSLFITGSIGNHSDAADDVMAAGFNWCPPVAMMDAISSVTDFIALIKERIPSVAAKIDIEHLLADVGHSKYDYRSYFKAKK